MTTDTQKQKIAILGGGISSLGAAYALTTPEGWQDNYDVTIYSLGWRMGGKGATGRDPRFPHRVMEHGLHVWFGCYHNAFRMMYNVYEDLDRPAGVPIRTVQEAFDPQSFAVYMEYINEQWEAWEINFPTNDEFPGVPPDPSKPDDVPLMPSPWEHLKMILELVHDHFHRSDLADGVIEPKKPDDDTQFAYGKPHWWDRLESRIGHKVTVGGDIAEALMLDYALHLMNDMSANPADHSAYEINLLKWLLDRFKKWLINETREFFDSHPEIRHFVVLLDLGLSLVIGLLRDGFLQHGLNPLDQYDFREWLKRNGALEMTCWCGIINGIYDSFFAYKYGDSGDRAAGNPGQPDFAAGSCISVMLNMPTYKGAIMFKMRAGTGDTVIAPIYELLVKRGVKFEFFRRVERITQADGAVDAVYMARQVDVKNGAPYEPLIEVGGLPAWPAHPLYEQLVQGEELKASGANLESLWATWHPVGQEVLRAGEDFDKLILGISIGALPTIAEDLIEANPDWQTMVDTITSIKTQSAQLWFTPTTEELGWTAPPPMMTGYESPFSSWADFSQIIPWEEWELQPPPQSVFYTSNSMQDTPGGPPPHADHAYPQEQLSIVWNNIRTWLEANADVLWPDATDGEGGLDWSVLEAPDDLSGEARLFAQYARSNIDPSERYVLSPSGGNSTARLKPYDTGYSNLYCVGTWTYNFAYNISAMEIAVVSGLQVSRAICGYPKHIVGEHLT